VLSLFEVYLCLTFVVDRFSFNLTETFQIALNIFNKFIIIWVNFQMACFAVWLVKFILLIKIIAMLLNFLLQTVWWNLHRFGFIFVTLFSFYHLHLLIIVTYIVFKGINISLFLYIFNSFLLNRMSSWSFRLNSLLMRMLTLELQTYLFVFLYL
jgi:hypothetical protein